jgi:hypothetical protein
MTNITKEQLELIRSEVLHLQDEHLRFVSKDNAKVIKHHTQDILTKLNELLTPTQSVIPENSVKAVQETRCPPKVGQSGEINQDVTKLGEIQTFTQSVGGEFDRDLMDLVSIANHTKAGQVTHKIAELMDKYRPYLSRNASGEVECGCANPNGNVALTYLGGCGKSLKMKDAYRCGGCGGWFHKECLYKHFEQEKEHDYGRVKAVEEFVAWVVVNKNDLEIAHDLEEYKKIGGNNVR